jgi:hypothetical protein
MKWTCINKDRLYILCMLMDTMIFYTKKIILLLRTHWITKVLNTLKLSGRYGMKTLMSKTKTNAIIKRLLIILQITTTY